MTNRLAAESSPYLQQHADNPVDWYPWGDEAFERARAEDKPILLSVGYAACHWCHVMAHESFEDDGIAALMNERFVNVKVDREERPDIDSIYMEAVQAMTGQGGWPMTVFLTPDGEPFFGGTYFPPTDRHGLPSFRRVLQALDEKWRQERSDVEQWGRRLVDHLGASAQLSPSGELISEDVLRNAHQQLRTAFDPAHGGFGGAPKFPQAMNIDLLLRMAVRGYPEAEQMATKTLDAMAAGGMFDQLGGGFARYSVDRAWVVPHFEKMLYDNAQLLRTYSRSYLLTGNERHREVAEATAAWMVTEMRDPAGGFWSSMDADSEGEEGKYYVWTLDEVQEVAGDDAAVAIEHYGFTLDGNFEGKNIPTFTADVDDRDALERARAALLERRARRVRPGTDTKVLAGWNGLAASALAESGLALGRRDWVDAAADCLRFVLDTLRVDGRLMRSYRDVDGKPVIRAFGCSDDYGFVLEAALALYEATFELTWLNEAMWAADEAIRLFADEDSGGFFTTGADAQRLVVRPKDVIDNAVPSGNSVLALELQRLAEITGDERYDSYAQGAIRLVRGPMQQSAQALGHALQAVDLYTAGALEIVIVGDPQDTTTEQMLGALRSRYVPNKVVMAIAAPDDEAERRIPLLEGKTALKGRPTAYVCRAGTCKLPVSEVPAMLEQLDAA